MPVFGVALNVPLTPMSTLGSPSFEVRRKLPFEGPESPAARPQRDGTVLKVPTSAHVDGSVLTRSKLATKTSTQGVPPPRQVKTRSAKPIRDAPRSRRGRRGSASESIEGAAPDLGRSSSRATITEGPSEAQVGQVSRSRASHGFPFWSPAATV